MTPQPHPAPLDGMKPRERIIYNFLVWWAQYPSRKIKSHALVDCPVMLHQEMGDLIGLYMDTGLVGGELDFSDLPAGNKRYTGQLAEALVHIQRMALSTDNHPPFHRSAVLTRLRWIAERARCALEGSSDWRALQVPQELDVVKENIRLNRLNRELRQRLADAGVPLSTEVPDAEQTD